MSDYQYSTGRSRAVVGASFNPDRKAAFLEALAQGSSIQDALLNSLLGEHLMYRLRREDPVFRASLIRARAAGKAAKRERKRRAREWRRNRLTRWT